MENSAVQCGLLSYRNLRSNAADDRQLGQEDDAENGTWPPYLQTGTGRLPSNVHRKDVVENADVVYAGAHVAIVGLHDASVVDLKGRSERNSAFFHLQFMRNTAQNLGICENTSGRTNKLYTVFRL